MVDQVWPIFALTITCRSEHLQSWITLENVDQVERRPGVPFEKLLPFSNLLRWARIDGRLT